MIFNLSYESLFKKRIKFVDLCRIKTIETDGYGLFFMAERGLLNSIVDS